VSPEESKQNRAIAKEKLLKKRERFRERLLAACVRASGVSSSSGSRKVVINTVAATAGGSVEWNKARKEAADKRERENGKFKRCKSKWVSLVEFQKQVPAVTLPAAPGDEQII
jgi:hypothetical protein